MWEGCVGGVSRLRLRPTTTTVCRQALILPLLSQAMEPVEPVEPPPVSNMEDDQVSVDPK